jgi:hypothetical protein
MKYKATTLWAYKYYKSDEKITLTGLIQAQYFDDAYDKLKASFREDWEDKAIFCVIIHIKNIKKTGNKLIDL